MPIGAHQAVQHPLAEAYVHLEAAWALLVSVAVGYTTDVGLLEPYLRTRLFRSVPVSRELGLNQIAMEALGLPARTNRQIHSQGAMGRDGA